MATVEEIERAIRALSPDERIRLAHALPALIPELDGDVLWEASARDSAKRPSLSTALDELDADSYIRERAARGSREKFDRVLSTVPDVEPEAQDRLSPDSMQR